MPLGRFHGARASSQNSLHSSHGRKRNPGPSFVPSAWCTPTAGFISVGSDDSADSGLDSCERYHHQQIADCHQALLRDVQSHVSEVFVTYEDKMLQLLQTAMESTVQPTVGCLSAGSVATATLVEATASQGAMELEQVKENDVTDGPHTAPLRVSFENPEKDGDEKAKDMSHPITPGSRNTAISDGHALFNDRVNQRTKIFSFEPEGEANIDNIHENVYDVANFYKTKGPAQHIARSQWFGNCALGLISANAIYLGLDADLNKEDLLIDAKWYWIVGENVFCVLFTAEIIVRFLAFDHKRNCLKDFWFKFDFILVVLMIGEVWGMLGASLVGISLSGIPTAPLRLLRLFRLSRLVRLMRALPELVTMIKGMRSASRAVASSVVMVLFLVYVFSIVMLMTTDGIWLGRDDEHAELVRLSFETLSVCMWTMLMDGTFMTETGPVLLALRELDHLQGYMAVCIFLAFILLSSLTVLNMLIGVLCEVVSAVGQHERNEADIRLVKKGILKELIKFDSDGDGTISKAELETVMRSNKARLVLEDLEVDPCTLDEIHGMLFKNPTDKVEFKAILETCLNYRGSQAPTVKHLVDSMVFNRVFIEKIVRECTQDLTRTVVRQNETVRLSVVKLLNASDAPKPAKAREAAVPHEPPRDAPAEASDDTSLTLCHWSREVGGDTAAPMRQHL